MANCGSNPQAGTHVNDLSSNAYTLCEVKPITLNNRGGLHIKPNWLAQWGFSPQDAEEKPASILLQQGTLVITNNPKQLGLLKALQELQYRQDETQQDFADGIECLLANIAKSS